ncbi:hypothetical protein V1527DRAFT_486376 [Lipomyces starkeyi]
MTCYEPYRARRFAQRVPTGNALVTSSTAGGMVKFNGKNYRQWAMYMEALHVHRGEWDVVSGLGSYNSDDLEDANVITKKNNIAGLGTRSPPDNIWKSMKTRYQQPSLVRQLAFVIRLFSWKCPNEANPDKWVQEWCDLLKEFLNLQVRQEDFWKVVMVNNMPFEYGVAISSLGDISDVPIREMGTKLSARLSGLKGQQLIKSGYDTNSDPSTSSGGTETAMVAKQTESRACYNCGNLATLPKTADHQKKGA